LSVPFVALLRVSVARDETSGRTLRGTFGAQADNVALRVLRI
jgi:hypothetical protein